MPTTIRRSQLKTLDLFKTHGEFTVRDFANREGISTPSARSRLVRLRDHGWLRSKKMAGPTSDMDVFRISAKGVKALARGVKEWSEAGIDALS